MRSFLLVLTLFLFLKCTVRSQLPTPSISCKEEFYLNYLTNADSTFAVYDLVTLPGGDIIICGITNHAASANDAVFMRVTPNGDRIWERTFALSQSNYCSEMIATRDGNLVAVGAYDDNAGNFLVKFDPSGNLIWHRQYSYNKVLPENAFAQSVREDDQGNLYTINYFIENYLSFNDRIGMQKYDPNGNLLWSKKIRGAGGLQSIRIGDFIVRDGYSYITGTWHSGSYYSGVFIKIDNRTGNVSAGKIYSHNNNELSLSHILPTPNGFVLCGRASINATDTCVLYSTDINGNLTAAHYLSYSRIRDFERYITDGSGNIYYGVGQVNSDQYTFAKINLDAGILWMNDYPIAEGATRLESMEADESRLYFGGYLFTPSDKRIGVFGKITAELGETYCPRTPLKASFGVANAQGRDTGFYSFDHPMYSFSHTISTPVTPAVTEKKCIIESICDSIDLPEAYTFCKLNDTLNLSFYKNPACLLGVEFQFDHSMFSLVKQTDSVATLVALKAGSSMIYAVINSDCGELKDSVRVTYRDNQPLNLGRDTAMCAEVQLTLNAPEGYADYLWNNGSTTSALVVNGPGKYYVTARDYCGNQHNDTITVSALLPPTFDAGADLTLCEKEAAVLTAPAGFTDYHWLPGYNMTIVDSRSVRVQPERDTVYVVRAMYGGLCTVTDSVRITILHAQRLFIGNDTALCKGTSVTIGSTGFINYQWSNGSNDSSIAINRTGEYVLSAEAINGCWSTDTVFISMLDTPRNFLQTHYVFCNNKHNLIYADNGYDQYVWHTGATSSIMVADTTGTYTLTVIDGEGCRGTESTVVTIDACYNGVVYPNAFTPNGDGKNDTYKPVVNIPTSYYQFTIYNRWGQVVFTTSDVDEGWNGFYHGKPGDSGTYAWKCIYEQTGKRRTTDKGIVLLLR